MKLNEWDYKHLDFMVEIFERDKYFITSRILKAIIRKIKRDD